MIIDMHAQVYPPKIARKAVGAVGLYYNIPMRHSGTPEDLLANADAAGIDKMVIHSVATAPQQVRAVNAFVAQTAAACPERLTGFMTLHPDCEQIPQLAEEALQLGLKGLKLHPDFQHFDCDSPAAMRLYEVIEGRMPLLIHAGDYRTGYTKPARIARIKRTFPNLDIVAAHLGGWSEWGNGIRELADLGIYVDTSSSLYAIRPGFARLIMDTFGMERVLFGTDYPMWDAKTELERLLEVPMTPEEREMLLHGNWERLMGPYI